MDRSYFVHNVSVSSLLGISGNGNNVYSDPVNQIARIEPRTEIVKNPQGVEIVARGFVLLPAKTRYAPGSKIVYDGITYKLISSEPVYAWEEDHVEGWLE